jgi:glycogen debranching enzyme
MPREKAERMVQAATDELLTPVGLRSLARSDPGYTGRDDPDGSPDEGRGGAWPWLAGAYFDALVRLHGEDGKRAARAWLQGFQPRLEQACLGHVAACFDGDPPHRARGPLAHALGTAELLRVAARMGREPRR